MATMLAWSRFFSLETESRCSYDVSEQSACTPMLVRGGTWRKKMTQLSSMLNSLIGFLLASCAIACSCLPPDQIQRSCKSGELGLHIRAARDVGTCTDTYSRVYEVEVLDVLMNSDSSMELTVGELIQIRTAMDSAACGQYLEPDSEYLLYVQKATPLTSLGFPLDADAPASSNASCGVKALLETGLCSGNLQQPSEADLNKARSICAVQGGVVEENGASSMEELPAIISAVCIIMMGVFRLAVL
jgi:hypothetical protein